MQFNLAHFPLPPPPPPLLYFCRCLSSSLLLHLLPFHYFLLVSYFLGNLTVLGSGSYTSHQNGAVAPYTVGGANLSVGELVRRERERERERERVSHVVTLHRDIMCWWLRL